MDLQKLLNAFSATQREARSQYHVTLGDAVKALEQISAVKPVVYDDGKSPNEAMSYRGYYHDLAMNDADGAVTSSDLLEELKAALGSEMTGYKGGGYTMGDETPMWRSEYGDASGVAWVGIVETPDFVLIQTKQID